jgi:uncharacterized protein YbjT (DUF2867 family)
MVLSHIGRLRRLRGMPNNTMRIAIVGGTGLLGGHVADELRSRGHDVRVLSRRSPDHPVDLTTGDGLGHALAGCDVVVDAANAAKDAARTLVDGSRRLLAAEEAAGVGHHVGVSIVGCELVPLGYFQVKAEQEQVIERGPVPWSLVRATQFHELVAATMASAGRWRVLPVPHATLQTVASAEVARVVADSAENAPRLGRVQVAGPEITDARELARTWRSITGRRALLLPVPLPGKPGRALRAGALTAERPDVRGTLSFADWLRAGRDRDPRPAVSEVRAAARR